MIPKFPYMLILLLAFARGCEDQEENSGTDEPGIEQWNSMIVTASAYNSLQEQGQGDAQITAWGDTLVPGMRSVAVSRDLISKGLTYGTPLIIEGMEGKYTVNDKMHPRWKNKIDIYMGTDQERALEWGRRKVEICFPSNKEPH